jgi:hypothetical protein
MAKTIKYSKLKRDMECWPGRWKGVPADVLVGKKIVQPMHPFVQATVEAGLARSTIHRHLNNLWLLGGEIISRLYHDPELKDLTGDELLLRFVEQEGGPYSRHLSIEAEQRAFDGTCRKLYRFLDSRFG